MKLVIGCPIKDREWSIPFWLDGIHDQELMGVDVQIVCLYTQSTDKTLNLLSDADVQIIYDFTPGRTTHEIDGHLWGSPQKYQYMATIRNRLRQEVISMEADYFFSLDSDIVLPKYGLSKLLSFAVEHPGIVSPAVNMTYNYSAWNVMDWVENGRADRKRTPLKAQRADVIMAAILMDVTGLQCHWEMDPQGEDVGLCKDAERRNIGRWWVPDVRCDHLMRKFQI